MSKVTVEARVAKTPEAGVGKTKGTPYAKFTLVQDSDDGAIWYNAIAFGGLSKLLMTRLKKGMEIRVLGKLTEKEFTRKDGSVGVDKSLMVDSVVLEGGEKLSKFDAPTEPSPF